MMRTLLTALACVLLAGCGDDGGGLSVCTADEQCDDGVFCNGTERCAPTEAAASATGCIAGVRPCELGSACIETDDRCEGGCATPDGDGDGVDRLACGGDDCDDEDADRYPGNEEVCDAEGHDEDCDLNTIGALDRDRDGFVDDRCRNEGGATGVDCNDREPGVSPIGEEACNGRDDDCDGDVDEGLTVDGYADADADGHGDPDAPLRACPGRARFAEVGDDCDDADPTIFAGQIEICDSEDNDCDGLFDEGTRPVFWFPDADADGYGDAAGPPVLSCEPVAGHALLPTDCDDTRGEVNPAALETCNGIDDDCNGVADFDAGGGHLEDDDRDGVPDEACGGADCDDRDPLVAGTFSELCNGQDDDCDGMVDEATDASDWYGDGDGDGVGAGPAMRMCIVGSAFVPSGDDCDDTDRAVLPGATERCNGVDDDCDGNVDEGATARCAGPSATYRCADGFCQVSRCGDGLADCDGNAANGCETDVLTSLTHCGECGRPCGGVCQNGGCNLGSAPLFTITVEDIDGVPVDTALVSRTGTASTSPSPVDGSGQAVIRPDGPSWYRFDAESFTSAVYPATERGLEAFSAFGGFLDIVLARESEVAAWNGAPTPTKGILVLTLEGTVAAGATQPVFLSLGSDAAFHAPDVRPLVLTPGAFFDEGSSLVVFTEVDPGAAVIASPGCLVPDPDVRVYPGAITIARVECF